VAWENLIATKSCGGAIPVGVLMGLEDKCVMVSASLYPVPNCIFETLWNCYFNCLSPVRQLESALARNCQGQEQAREDWEAFQKQIQGWFSPFVYAFCFIKIKKIKRRQPLCCTETGC
jgi:hypothetical protein